MGKQIFYALTFLAFIFDLGLALLVLLMAYTS